MRCISAVRLPEQAEVLPDRRHICRQGAQHVPADRPEHRNIVTAGIAGDIWHVCGFKHYWKEDFSGFRRRRAACFVAFCGYAVAGLANDSVISVAPVFWALLGLGVGINIKLKRERKEEKRTDDGRKNK